MSYSQTLEDGRASAGVISDMTVEAFSSAVEEMARGNLSFEGVALICLTGREICAELLQRRAATSKASDVDVALEPDDDNLITFPGSVRPTIT